VSLCKSADGWVDFASAKSKRRPCESEENAL